jgi:hypothetical protein
MNLADLLMKLLHNKPILFFLPIFIKLVKLNIYENKLMLISFQ